MGSILPVPKPLNVCIVSYDAAGGSKVSQHIKGFAMDLDFQSYDALRLPKKPRSTRMRIDD